jgi:D-Tyr-tRNAtyr deacylase
MKALVQRVVSGSVAVDGETVSRIGRGIVALIGIHRYPGGGVGGGQARTF